MSLLLSILCLLFFVWTAWVFCRRIFKKETPPARRWLVSWTLKGAVAPVLIWFVMNLGLPSVLPPFLPSLRSAQGAGTGWVPLLMSTTAAGVFVIASYWATLTCGWFIAIIWHRHEEARGDIRTGFLSTIIALPIGLVLFASFGWYGLGFIGFVWLSPIVYHALQQNTFEPPLPSYSRAVARMKLGKYNEAEWEVIHELEKRQDDFEGWMMLAELYGTHFRDLAAADQTVHDLCRQPNITPVEFAQALQRLAHWHLKLADDPVAARKALEEICQHLPGSHLAKMARLRIDQLPASREEWLAQRAGRRIRLPVLGDHLDHADAPAESETNRAEAVARANRCVEKLKQNPNDAPAREEFARLLAERLGKADVALDQMALLLGMANQPPEKRAEWLELMAAWQIKYRKDFDQARVLLERLLAECPDSPLVLSARHRLNLMNLEKRFRKARPADQTPMTVTGKPELPT